MLAVISRSDGRPRSALLFAAALATLGGVALTFVAAHRWTLEYNESGRFFDPVSSVVYDDGARLAYTVLAVAFWMVALVCAWLGRRIAGMERDDG